MPNAAQNPGVCWWCESAPADSREHKLKRTDLVHQLGRGPYKEPNSARDGRSRNIQGPNSALAKFKATMCERCNNQHSQPFDLAYDQFTGYIHENEKHVLASRSVDLRAVYEGSWQAGRDGLLRFMAKHVGCRLAENRGSRVHPAVPRRRPRAMRRNGLGVRDPCEHCETDEDGPR